MRLYKLTWGELDAEQIVTWCRSKRRAEHLKANLDDGHFSSIEPVDVPTKKSDLLAWLNQHWPQEHDFIY
jgi:hypothetical protein